jgi:hypothetical protein
MLYYTRCRLCFLYEGDGEDRGGQGADQDVERGWRAEEEQP